ncbi:hypothetical protein HK101_007353 [Irineochytrium annulatum]|nr:hypothetical protein HK101_007353 [Irineochytrium annulatum]
MNAEKRASHNAIERARRESLNIRFQELAQGIPSLNSVRKPSKAVIVSRAIDHVAESNARIEVKTRALAAIRDRNRELLMEVNRLRDILGLPLESEEILVDEDMVHEASLAAAAAAQAARHFAGPPSASSDTFSMNGDMSGLATPTSLSAMSSPITPNAPHPTVDIGLGLAAAFNGGAHLVGRQGGPASPEGMIDELDDEELDSAIQHHHQQQQQHYQHQQQQNASLMPNAMQTPPAESPVVEDASMQPQRHQHQPQPFDNEPFAGPDSRFFDEESLTQLLHSASQQPMPVPIPSPTRRASNANPQHPAAHHQQHQYDHNTSNASAGGPVSLSSSLHSFSTASQSFHHFSSTDNQIHRQQQNHHHHAGSMVMPSPATSMIYPHSHQQQPNRMASSASIYDHQQQPNRMASSTASTMTLEDELMTRTPIAVPSSGGPGLIHRGLQMERREGSGDGQFFEDGMGGFGRNY